jgi:SAM-dependent methyltransferase
VGQRSGWKQFDRFGYQWGGKRGFEQTAGNVSELADTLFRPFTNGNYQLDITELSPGAGRFAAELLRYARSMALVDMNSVCIEICKRRFEDFPTLISFYVNDGRRLDMLAPNSADVIACYDSMVHMHPEIVASYVFQMCEIVRPGGLLWLDHGGRGAKEHGHRTAMTADGMAEIAGAAGLIVLSQVFRNDWDCVSVLQRPD